MAEILLLHRLCVLRAPVLLYLTIGDARTKTRLDTEMVGEIEIRREREFYAMKEGVAPRIAALLILLIAHLKAIIHRELIHFLLLLFLSSGVKKLLLTIDFACTYTRFLLIGQLSKKRHRRHTYNEQYYDSFQHINSNDFSKSRTKVLLFFEISTKIRLKCIF